MEAKDVTLRKPFTDDVLRYIIIIACSLSRRVFINCECIKVRFTSEKYMCSVFLHFLTFSIELSNTPVYCNRFWAKCINTNLIILNLDNTMYSLNRTK